MGGLTLPSAGSAYLDTDAIIYSVEKIEPYWSVLEPLWRDAQRGLFAVLSSELALLETLVKPLRTGDKRLEKTYRDLLTATREVRLVPIDRSIIEAAARLRAIYNLKTPDAIHAATALANNCQLFVSNDQGFRRVPNLTFSLLSDLVSP